MAVLSELTTTATVLDSLAFTAGFFSGIIVVLTLYEVFLDLRAKARARKILSRKAATDPTLQHLVNQMATQNEADIETASKAISIALGDELSDSDRRRV